MTQSLLSLQDLCTYYFAPAGVVKAADGVTMTINHNECFGIVGESGCGKSTTIMSILRLVSPPGRIVSGKILLNRRDSDSVSGTPAADDLTKLSEPQMRRVRGARVSLIPQGAMDSLIPVMSVYDQVADVITAHEGRRSRNELEQRIGQLLTTVGLSPDAMRLLPNDLSGSMKQRVCVAMAIALNPQLIIADEPTNATDEVVQRLLVETMMDAQERLRTSVILVGQSIGVLAQFVSRLCVMYAGRVAEISNTRAILSDPLHPYTQMLAQTIPSLAHRRPLFTIPGLPPSLRNLPPGCLFHPRCPKIMPVCKQLSPPLCQVGTERVVACHLYRTE